MQPAPVSVAGFELSGERTRLRDLMAELRRSLPLIRMLARKEFFVRYRRALFGVVWAVALPLLQAVLLAAIVRRFARFELPISYMVFVYAGMVVWSFFGTSVTAGSTAIADSFDLSSKIYFPRAVLPIAKVWAEVYGLQFSLAALLVVCVATRTGIRLSILLAVPAIALLLLLANALSTALSVAHVYFRDVRHLVQASLMAWFYVTPIFYPLDATGGFRPFIEANPLTGVIELLRAAISGATGDLAVPLAWSLSWTAFFLVAAVVLNCRYDRVVADLL